MRDMRVDIDELSPVQRKVRVELPVEAVASEFSRAYKNLGRRVRVKGFRSGKIPRSVLQGIYGTELKDEVRAHLVQESLGEVIRARGLQIVSRPEIEADDLSEADAFSFSAVFEVKPEVAVRDYLGMEIEKPGVTVTGDQIEEALRGLQEGHARLEVVVDRDVVGKGDFVTVDFEGTVEGRPVPGGKGENYIIEVGAGRALPQFEAAVIGLKVNEHRTVPVSYPEHFANKELAGRTVDFSLAVREIKQKVLPPIDEDFAKDYGECASLEELKESIRTRLTGELQRYQNEDLKEKIIGKLIEAHSFEAPRSMVERQTRYLMERYQNQISHAASDGGAPPVEEARKMMEARAYRQVQATLLLEKIAELEKLEVSDKDVQERVDQLARAAGERGKAVREFYSRAEARDDLRAQLLFDRTAEFLLERAQIKEVDLPRSEVDEQGEKR